MNNFFLNGYPNENFKFKDDIVAYIITVNYDEKTLSKLKKLGDKIFNGTATKEERDKESILIPKIINDLFKSLILKSNLFYLEYREDFDEDKYVYQINKNEIFNQESLGKLLKNYNYFGDIGFSFYGDKEDWGYFSGEDLYAKFPGDISEFKHFHLFTVKKSFQNFFINTVKEITKNEAIIEKMNDRNIVTLDNEDVYEIYFEKPFQT